LIHCYCRQSWSLLCQQVIIDSTFHVGIAKWV